jgi:signal peptidase I
MGRFKERFLKFWHTDNPKMAVVRDVAVAAAIVGLLLAIIWIYSGQPLRQAPVVSVESGSMMHGPFGSGSSSSPTHYGNPSFGRIGTIDPGDIVFVKRVDGPEDVEVAFGAGGRGGYGGHGDVIVFMPNGEPGRTRVIHRAMLFVEAVPEGCQPGVDCTYRVPAFCDNPGLDEWAGRSNHGLGKYCEGSRDPLVLRLERDGLVLDIPAEAAFPCASGGMTCPAFHSGFITKGDNNLAPDQQRQSGISQAVRIEWVIGKARGEIPWFGLIKLALYGNKSYNTGTDPTQGSNWKILAASAPWDIWLSLFLALAILVSIPMGIDVVTTRLSKRKRGQGPPP